jgi:hypothetical protein
MILLFLTSVAKRTNVLKLNNVKARKYIGFTAKENSRNRGAIRLLSRGV